MRVAVMGYTGGIGEATVTRLADMGHEVVGLGRRVAGHPLCSRTYALNLEDAVDHEAALAKIFEDSGPYDALINLTGGDILSEPWRSRSYQDKLHYLWSIDVLGAIALCRAMVPFLKDGGQMVNTAWDHAVLGVGGDYGELYGTIKAAVIGFSKAFAKSHPNLRVNVLAPGWVKTRWANNLSDGAQGRVIKKAGAASWQTPEQMAEVLAWMLTAPILVSGQVFYANGGGINPS